MMNLKDMFSTKVIHSCVIYGVDELYINDIDHNIIKRNYIQNMIVN
jgi:hypothetical protein